MIRIRATPIALVCVLLATSLHARGAEESDESHCAAELVQTEALTSQTQWPWVQFKTPPRPWNFRRVDKNYISVNSQRAWVAEPELWTTTFVRHDGLIFKQAMREREQNSTVGAKPRVEGFLEDSPFYVYQAEGQLGGFDSRQLYAPEIGVRTPTVLNTSESIERIDLHLRSWVDGMKSVGNRREVPVTSLQAFLPQSGLAVFSLKIFHWNVRGPRNHHSTDQNRLILRSLYTPGPDGHGANRNFAISYPYPSKSRGFKAPKITSVLGVFDESVLLVMWVDGSFAAYSAADGKLLAKFQIPAEARQLLAGDSLRDTWVRDAQPEEKWILPLARHGSEWAYLALQPARLLSGNALSIELKPEVPYLSGSIEERLPRNPVELPVGPEVPGLRYADAKRKQPMVHDIQGNWWVLLPKTRALR